MHKLRKLSILYVLLFSLMVIPGALKAVPLPGDPVFTPELNKLQEAIANQLTAKIKLFTESYNKSGNGNITISSTFYDSRYHKLYIDFQGEVKISDSIKKLFASHNSLLSGDGYIAYDLSIGDLTNESAGAKSHVTGDLIVFIDEIVFRFSAATPGLNEAYSPAAKTLLKFLNDIDVRPLAAAMGKTLTDFSSENLENLRKEVKTRIDATGNTASEKFFFLLKQSGNLTAFFFLQFVKNLPGIIAGTVGETLGATLGTFLVPGVGTAVGGFIGSMVICEMTRTKVHKIPAEFEIVKIKKFGKMANEESLKNDWLLKKIDESRASLRELINKDLEANSYVLVDDLLDTLRKANPAEKKILAPSAADLKSLLEFQLNQKQDRYAERKLKQFSEINMNQ
ncbi:MAG: hypothetical protein HQM08_08040 [Candidatus Riflebacteria bacterium]|nr:hypothetical protein [Candidatus Riflebacteria bacterium]